MPTKAGHVQVGEVTATPVDFIETAALISALLGGIAGATGKSAVEAGIKGSGLLVEYLRKEGPLAYRVLASWREDNAPCVAIEFINVTLHGAYVESIESIKPGKDFAFDVAKPKRKGRPIAIGIDEDADGEESHPALTWTKPEATLPVYVAPAAAVTVLIRLADDAAGTLRKSTEATLRYHYAIVGGSYTDGSGAKPKDITVRLRSAGPHFLQA